MLRVFVFILTAFSITACEESNSQKDTAYESAEEYNQRLDSTMSNFFFARYNAYHNLIDRFLVEKQFNHRIQTDLELMMWRPGRILFNSFDTLRNRRDIIMMDKEAKFFEIAAENNSYTESIKAWDSVAVHGKLLGYIFNDSDVKSDPELAEPYFIAIADSIKILKRTEKKHQ